MPSQSLYDLTLENMEATLHDLAARVSPPQLVPFGSGSVFRYVEQTIYQALVQKLARVVSGLHAARVLLAQGSVQELGALQRMLDETHEDIQFLAIGAINNDLTDKHRRYLSAFYEEEFDDPDSSMKSTQKRPMIPCKEIRAYIANSDGTGLDPSRQIEAARTLQKTYSGFVHGASPHIMEMYCGNPPSFHIQGLLGTARAEDHHLDLQNYFYRGIVVFALLQRHSGTRRSLVRYASF
jgi:hypothetical protein